MKTGRSAGWENAIHVTLHVLRPNKSEIVVRSAEFPLSILRASPLKMSVFFQTLCWSDWRGAHVVRTQGKRMVSQGFYGARLIQFSICACANFVRGHSGKQARRFHASCRFWLGFPVFVYPRSLLDGCFVCFSVNGVHSLVNIGKQVAGQMAHLIRRSPDLDLTLRSSHFEIQNGRHFPLEQLITVWVVSMENRIPAWLRAIRPNGVFNQEPHCFSLIW